MDIRIVTGDLSYSKQWFPILALGNWGVGPEGGGHLGEYGRRMLQANI